jgi:hypothetical protein
MVTIGTGQLQLAFAYLFETGGCVTVHSQHNRRGANKRGRHEQHVIVDLWYGADTESNDTSTCNGSK